jgi:large subunit ribosomal protein L28
MSKICEITGKKVITGNNVSHSNARTKRRFYPNLQTKKFYIPEEDTYITLKVSAAGIRKINKNGITSCMNEAIEKGFLKRKKK